MTDAAITIHHNADCGTPRNTLAPVRNSIVEPRVIEHLKAPPGCAKLVERIAAARWMRMITITIPNPSSAAKTLLEFDEAGRMKPRKECLS